MALFLVALSIDAEHNYYASHMYIVTYEYGKVRSNLYRNLQGSKIKVRNDCNILQDANLSVQFKIKT